MTETDIQRLVQREASKIKGIRLFRNQVGCYKLQNGTYLHSGLFKGSSDLIGWKTVEITEDMVGKKIAVFLSVEVKTQKGKTTPEQEHWLSAISNSGGIALVARSPHDINEIAD